MSAGNLLATYAKLWFAPIGEANPDPDSVGYGAAWGGNWKYLGDTLKPLSMSGNINVESVFVQQSTSPICEFVTSEELTLSTTVAAHDLENYQLAFGGAITTTAAGASQVGMSELKFGGETTRPEYKWGFETLYTDLNGVQLPWRYFFYKGTASLSGSIDFDRTSVDGIPMNIKTLADTSLPAGQQMAIIQHVTAPATS